MTNIQTPSGSLAVQVDGQTCESWTDILAQFEDASIYQTWAYGAVRWGVHNLSHMVMRKDGRIVAAAQLRIARVPMLPAGVAYLRWGPMCQLKGEPFDAAVVADMVSFLRNEHVRRRGLALQIIPHVFSEDERADAFHAAFERSCLHPEPSLGHYRTVMVDLNPPAEIIRKRLDQKWRNQLNGSEKNSLVLEVSDGPKAYREFVELYKVMRERKQFETSVDVEEFGRIQNLLYGPARMQTFLAKIAGQSIGALVCHFLGDTGIYLLGATNERARELKAAYFLQWQVMLWLKQHGARWYDLGGIDPTANPGGYRFKSGFGGAEATLIPPCAASGSALSHAVLSGITWLRGRRALRNAPVEAPR